MWKDNVVKHYLMGYTLIKYMKKGLLLNAHNLKEKVTFRNLFFLVLICFAFLSVAYAQTGPNYSSEYAYSSFSPSGALGGSSIPASCESGLGQGGAQHSPFDTYGNCPGYPPPAPVVNQPPWPPIVTINNGNAYTSLPISAVSTDPENNTIQYRYYDIGPPYSGGTLWTQSGYITSGQTDNKMTPATWMAGNHDIQVLACDSGSGSCTVSYKTVYLSYVTPPAPVVTLTANPSSLNFSDTQFTLNWSAQNVSSCQVVDDPADYTYGWIGQSSQPPIVTPSGSFTISNMFSDFTETFAISCQPLEPGPLIISSVTVTKNSAPTNGACGSAGSTNGNPPFVYQTSAPTSNLCSVGNPTPVNGTGPWGWQCQGINFGSDSQCVAYVNQAPTANAGPDKTLVLPANSTVVNGSGTNPDGPPISTYSWTNILAPGAFTIQSPTSANTSINGLVQGTYVFRLKVTDDLGGTGTDDVQINVIPLPPPPTVTVTITPSTVTAGNSFTISMSSTNADSCTWTRTGTYAGNWASQPVPPNPSGSTSYNSGPLNFLVGNATYKFDCFQNSTATWVSNQKTVTVTQPSTTIDDVTINSSPVTTDGTTQYTITATASDSSGGTAVTTEYVLINNTSSNYRGYLGWSNDNSFPSWAGEYKAAPILCTNGGYGAIRKDLLVPDTYGSSYINLVSCSTVVTGNERWVSFRLKFNTNFATPLNNTLYGYMESSNGASPSPGALPSAWPAFDTFTVTTAPPPVMGGVMINSNSVLADSSTQYTITATSSDSIGASNIGSVYVNINRQGVNAGQYRGYLGWSTATQNFPYWDSDNDGFPDIKTGTTPPLPVGCSGGDGAIRSGSGSGWGSSYLDLVSCSTSVAGNVRTNIFVVKFNNNFTTPLNDNTLSGVAINNANIYSAWQPFDTFNLANNTPAVVLSANPTSVIPNQTVDITWDILGSVPASGSCAISAVPVIANWAGTLTGGQITLGPHTRVGVLVSQTSPSLKTTYSINCGGGITDSVVVTLKWKLNDGKCEALKGENPGNSPQDCKNPGYVEI